MNESKEQLNKSIDNLKIGLKGLSSIAKDELGKASNNSSAMRYLEFGAIGLMILSVFLPWLGVSSQVLGYGGMGLSLSGYQIDGALIGFVVALVGLYCVFKKPGFTVYAGAANLVIAIGYMFGWFYDDPSVSGPGYAVTVSAKLGLYMFLIGAATIVGISAARKQIK